MKNKCPYCGHSVVMKNGMYGYFFGCTNYPTCHFSCDADIMPTDEFDLTVYQEWWEEEKDRREMEEIIMESRHGDWGCRD